MTTFSADVRTQNNTQMMTLPTEILIEDIKTTKNASKIANIKNK